MEVGPPAKCSRAWRLPGGRCVELFHLDAHLDAIDSNFDGSKM